jgi:hypothetical protein
MEWDGPSSRSDWGGAVAVDSTGHVVVAGTANYQYPSDDGDAWVVRLGPDGEVDWLRMVDRYGGHDAFNAVVVDAADRIMVLGETDNGTEYARMLAGYDADGHELWTRELEGAGGFGIGLAIAPSGRRWAVGSVWFAGTRMASITRVDEEGAVVAETLDPGLNGGAGAHAVVPDGDGVVVAGWHLTASQSRQLWLAGYDDALELAWAQVIPRGIDDAAVALARAPDGELWVAGHVGVEDGPGGLQSDVWLARVAADGELLEDWTLPGGDGPNYVGGFGLAVDTWGMVTMVGAVSNGYAQGYVAKFEADGSQVWSQIVGDGDTIGSTAFAVALDAAQNIVVTGYRWPAEGAGWDAFVRKLTP